MMRSPQGGLSAEKNRQRIVMCPCWGKAKSCCWGGVHTSGLECPLGRTNSQRRGKLPSSVWTRHRAVKQGKSGGSVGTTDQGKGKGSREGKIGQGVLCGGYSIFPLFLLPHFPQFPLLVFNVLFFFAAFPAHTFSPFYPFGFQSLFFCAAMFLLVQGGSPMINNFSIVSRPQFSHFSCSHIFPSFPFWFSMPFFFATFPAHTFSPFSHFGFQSIFYFCTAMFLLVQGGSPMINDFSIVSRPPFLFFRLGGGADLI